MQPQPLTLTDSQSQLHADCSSPNTPVREATTFMDATRACDTSLSHNRHPEVSAVGLHACISKRPFSIISPAKSRSRNAPSRKRQCTEQIQGKSLGIADFRLSEIETQAIEKLKRMATDYALLKVASSECNLPSPTPGQVTDSTLSTPFESGSEEERDNESYKKLEEDVDATMLEVFGDYDIQSVSENDSLCSVDMDDACV